VTHPLLTYITLSGDRRLSEAVAALRPVVVDENSALLLAPAIAARLTVTDDGVRLCDPTNGHPRFGRRGRPLDAIDAVNEFRAECVRDGDWLTGKLFR